MNNDIVVTENKIEGDTLDVLVVVDVQDCFMSNILNDNNLLNLGYKNNENEQINLDEKLKLSSTMVKKIAELSLSDKNQIVVFTRDMHPQNHISFEGDEGRPMDPPHGYWPHHCRTEKTCVKRTDAADTDKNIREPSKKLTSVETIKNGNPKIEAMLGTYSASKNANEVMVKGNQLSYFFYFTELADIVLKLNDPNTKAISLKSYLNTTEPKIGQIDFTSVQPINGKFYSLWKGERCNYESYSAFNYHLEYHMTRYKEDPGEKAIQEIIDSDKKITKDIAKKIAQWKNVQKPIKIDKNNNNKIYTTGLFEFIIQKVTKNPNIKIINFNICGLVGDVCVMHSAIQGSLLWETTYKELLPEGTTCNFNVELAATAFLGPGGYKPTEQGYYNDTKDKNVALEQYKNFYKSETEKYLYEAKYNFVLDGVDQSQPPTQSGGRKRTRRNRKFSMHKKHKQNCKCQFCLYGGGKRKSMKKRRQTKKRRYRR